MIKIPVEKRVQVMARELQTMTNKVLQDLTFNERAMLTGQLQPIMDTMVCTAKKGLIQAIESMKVKRDLFRRGQAVMILPFDQSAAKKEEWKKVDGQYELKLWNPVVNKYGYGQSSRHMLRNSDNKIVTFPPGTIGFIEAEYHPQTYRTTCNIRVSIKGYSGWTDWRNLCIHTYEQHT